MWFMNQIANPLVAMVLRSRWHGMMSATLLLITYTGRKSGKEYTLPVQYVQTGRTVYIVPGGAEKKTWWRNLRHGAPVRLWLAGSSLPGKADVLEGSSTADLTAQALDLYLRHFPAAAKMHTIRLAPDGSCNPHDLRRAASTAVVVRVELGL